MFSNDDGYQTEPVGGDRLKFPELKQRMKKKREEPSKIHQETIRLPPMCPPVSMSSTHTFASCDAPIIDAKEPSGHIHPCTRINQRVLNDKQTTLRSLQMFEVVKNNEHLAQSLHTFETLVAQLCSSPTTPIAANVVSQIDDLHDAIYKLESICCAMSTLYLSQKKTRRQLCSQDRFYLLAVFVFCVFFCFGIVTLLRV